MMTKTRFFTGLALFLLFSACGKDSSSSKGGSESPVINDGAEEPVKQPNLTLVVESDSGLPACAAENDNQLVYVKGTAEFKVCTSGAWAAISIKGEKGDAGAIGSKGDKGDKGDGGIGMTITQVISCPASVDLGTADYRKSAGTQITKFADGSFYMSCSAMMADSTFDDSHAASTFWPATSKGVIDGEISCVPFFVTAKFKPALKTAIYVAHDDVTKTETVSCTEIYPGL